MSELLDALHSFTFQVLFDAFWLCSLMPCPFETFCHNPHFGASDLCLCMSLSFGSEIPFHLEVFVSGKLFEIAKCLVSFKIWNG